MSKSVGVLGGGSFGITCANLLAYNSDVLMYVRRKAAADEVNQQGTLKGHQLSPKIKATTDISEIGKNCQLIIPVIPSKNFREVMVQIAPHVNPSHFMVHATKGLECTKLSLDTPSSEIDRLDVNTMSSVIQQETSVLRVGCIAGPNLSKEILAGQPAATVIASHFDEVIDAGRFAFEGPLFKVFGSHNLLGIELAGAFKNTLAIAAGMLAGLGFGKNVQSVSITRGLHEIIRIGMFFGAKKEAFLGIAGIADLIATATSENSRNYSLGLKIAEGKNVFKIQEEMDEVAEGVYTIKILHALINKHKIHAPIMRIIYKILFEDFPPEKAVPSLMKYPYSHDIDW